MTMPVDRERDRRSLQDLAKLASTGLTPPPPSVKAAPQSSPGEKKDDSGIVDLAAASQADPGAAARAQSTPLASQGLFDDDAAPRSAAAPQQAKQPVPSVPPMPVATPQTPADAFARPTMPSAPPPSVAPVSAAPAAPMSLGVAPVAALAPKQEKKGSVVPFVVGGLIAMAAAAAGGFLFLKHKADVEAQQLAALATPKVDVAPAPPAAPAPTTTTAEPAPAEPVADLAPAPETPAPDAKQPKLAMAGKPAAAAPKDPAAPAAPKDEPAKLTAKDLPKTAEGPAGDLGAAMNKAVGGEKQASGDQVPAVSGPQFAPGSVPQKPSQGAVTGAIGAVLPSARACLGPDDPVSHASVTFGSTGTVQSVSVRGPAAGKPAEACIKAALGKAKVAPFAEASYTAPITIRH